MLKRSTAALFFLACLMPLSASAFIQQPLQSRADQPSFACPELAEWACPELACGGVSIFQQTPDELGNDAKVALNARLELLRP